MTDGEANELKEIWKIYYKYWVKDNAVFIDDGKKHGHGLIWGHLKEEINLFWRLKAKIDEKKRITASQSKLIIALNQVIIGSLRIFSRNKWIAML